MIGIVLAVLFLSAVETRNVGLASKNQPGVTSDDSKRLSDDYYLPAILGRPPCVSDSPSWKVLILVYETTDFLFSDDGGIDRHFFGQLSQAEMEKINAQTNRFVEVDIPALNSCNMEPTITIRYPDHPLTNLTPASCSDYVPSPSDVANDRDPNFDSVFTIWDGSGTDLNSGEDLSIQGCAYAWGMGTGQTYDAIFADFVTHYNSRNVFKHEWGHSILFYYDAAGTAPDPAVNNHINSTTIQYVNCLTGESYILVDETDDNLIPNSIYNNQSGFTHDYYSGLTATADQPNRCLGITPGAWASGGPVSRPRSSQEDGQPLWRGPEDDVITGVMPYRPHEN
jgi:hypothetical protein